MSSNTVPQAKRSTQIKTAVPLVHYEVVRATAARYGLTVSAVLRQVFEHFAHADPSLSGRIVSDHLPPAARAKLGCVAGAARIAFSFTVPARVAGCMRGCAKDWDISLAKLVRRLIEFSLLADHEEPHDATQVGGYSLHVTLCRAWDAARQKRG